MAINRLLFCTVVFAALAFPAPLLDNGPLITHPGIGPGGTSFSRVQQSLGLSIIGFGVRASGGLGLADDFSVPAGGWYLTNAVVYGYQTNSTTGSTFTSAYARIWDGMPGASGSSVVFGDLSNRLIDSTFSGIYRDYETSVGSLARPIMANTLQLGVSLAPGTYWLEWGGDGTLGSGPFAPPITILGTTTTGNARQYSSGSWSNLTDDSSGQGIPFLLNGPAPGPSGIPEPSTWMMCGTGLALLAMRRRR